MATVKIFEVRDKGTCLPVVAIRLTADDPQEAKLAQRCGYGDAEVQPEYVLVAPLAGGAPLHYDVYARLEPTRTLRTAHDYIIRHFAELRPGAVVDVQWILGEIPAPRESDVR